MKKEETSSVITSKNYFVFWDKLAYYTLLAVLFLWPIWLWPSNLFLNTSGKRYMVALGVLVILFFYIIARLLEKRVVLSDWRLILIWFLPAISAFVSAFWATDSRLAWMGNGLDEFGAVWLLLLSLLGFLIFLVLNTKEKIFIWLSISVMVGGVAAFYTLAVFGIWLLGLEVNWSVSLIGRWHETALVLSGLVIMAVGLLRFLPADNIVWFKRGLQVSLGLMLLVLVLINYWPAWLVLFLASLIFILSDILWFQQLNDTNSLGFSYESLVVLLLAIMFVFILTSSGFFGDRLDSFYQRVGFSYSETKLSWPATYRLTKQSIVEHPLLGVGPNHLTDFWNKHKADGFLLSSFWNFNINTSGGVLTNWLLATGILGLFSWLIFILFWFYMVFTNFWKTLFKKQDKKMEIWLIHLLLILTTAMLGLIAVYPAMGQGLLMFFTVAGGTIAALIAGGLLPVKDYKFKVKGVLVFLFGLIIISACFYSLGTSWWAHHSFIKAVVASRLGDWSGAEKYLIRANTLEDDNDLYYRSRAELGLVDLRLFVDQIEQTGPEEESRFAELYTKAYQNIRRAQELSPTNYLNWLIAGRLNEFVISLVSPEERVGFYEEAQRAYRKALELNPKNPSVYGDLIRLNVLMDYQDKARRLAEEVLIIKPNYVPAVLFLAKADYSQDRKKMTEDRLLKFLNTYWMSTDVKSVLSLLGTFYYTENKFEEAAEVFMEILKRDSQDSLALYYGALTMAELGEITQAEKFLDNLIVNSQLESSVAEVVEKMKANLEAGRSILYGLKTETEIDLEDNLEPTDDENLIDTEESVIELEN
ncbi:MAG: hypothetical protein ACOCU8_01840 [Patescibacteria group bacterium]